MARYYTTLPRAQLCAAPRILTAHVVSGHDDRKIPSHRSRVIGKSYLGVNAHRRSLRLGQVRGKGYATSSSFLLDGEELDELRDAELTRGGEGALLHSGLHKI